ncbi:MAG: ElyC/SanA/YdcF family protein [Candidatus Magasanikiibacteriota bacterium]
MLTKRAKISFYSLLGLFLLFLCFLGINYYIKSLALPNIYEDDITKVGESQTALVLGAKVNSNGSLSAILGDRAKTALELYQNKKVKKILVSGDHGTTEYDEVNALKQYFLDNGVPGEDIFLDHAGFDTYDSIYRARDIFQVESLIIITQRFHLSRAVYIAEKLGLNVKGFSADKQAYRDEIRLEIRESLARIKAYFSILFNTKPKFLGEVIPITGDSHLSWD